jgi:Asp-tRNA(Asn)/Glu-tRNA(Gln) amidotransferase A subunit family amidase
VDALSQAFRAGTDNPIKALERVNAAADAAWNDRALLVRLPGAMDEARAAAKRFETGKALGKLDGVPLVIKDNIDVAGVPSTCGTAFLNQPASSDAALVSRLRAAGAVLFAKASMHEFGIQPTGVNPHHGTPVNPWDPRRIPGGSSSGSAVAVASGVAPAAIGTDAGGSVRIPSALNGLVGLKPSYGAVPLEGVARLASDLDHVGPLAWTVEDATLLLEVLANRVVDRSVSIRRPAILHDFFEGADQAIARVVRDAVFEVFGPCDEVVSPIAAWAAPVEFVIVGAGSVEWGREVLRRHAHHIGRDSRTLLQLGAGLGSQDRSLAEGVRAGMSRELNLLLERYDVLLAPAVGAQAPYIHPRARKTGELDPFGVARLASVCFPANLTGLPACSVPCVKDGLPTGLQVIGRLGGEAQVLSAARRVEARYGPRRPPRWHGR